jgi:hypothetical protein
MENIKSKLVKKIIKEIDFIENNSDNIITTEEVIEKTIIEVENIIRDFFKGQRISLKKKNSALPERIIDYTDNLLILLKEQLLFRLNMNDGDKEW